MAANTHPSMPSMHITYHSTRPVSSINQSIAPTAISRQSSNAKNAKRRDSSNLSKLVKASETSETAETAEAADAAQRRFCFPVALDHYI
jgi:hypothetical protein